MVELALDGGSGNLLLAPGGVVRVLEEVGIEAVGLPCDEGGIECGELGQEGAAEREAIEEDVVEDQAEAMIVGRKAEKETPEERGRLHVDGGGGLGSGEAEGLTLGIFRREMAEVDPLEPEMDVGVDDLEDVLASEGEAGPPGLVAIEELVERGFEKVRIEVTAVADGECLVVGGKVWLHGGMQPEAVLVGGDGGAAPGGAWLDALGLLDGGGATFEALGKEAALGVGEGGRGGGSFYRHRTSAWWRASAA